MTRLLRDRFVSIDDVRGWDLATGECVALADGEAPPDKPPLAPLIEVLDHGCDGRPRWIVTDAASRHQADALVRRAAIDATTRGFVALDVAMYLRWRAALEEQLDERALMLIAVGERAQREGQSALVDAAARSARPHVLLSVRVAASPERAMFVREARSVYAGRTPMPFRDRVVIPADVAEQLRRAARAGEFIAQGRHAAAERLLRDVAAALDRRGAHGRAVQTRLTLGRLLLDRGRAADADALFEAVVSSARAAGDDRAAIEARIWQAVARTDRAQLTAAEAICRAVLAVHAPDDLRARAVSALARVLLWQDRLDEIATLDIATVVDDEESWRMWRRAMQVRVLVRTGRVFEAGCAARDLLQDVSGCSPSPIRTRAHLAHLRVLVETGDVVAADERLTHLLQDAKRARLPLHAIRGRILWLRLLQRAGRQREARRELQQVRRLSAAAPPLLGRVVAKYVEGRSAPACAPTWPPASDLHRSASTLVRLIHDEEHDDRAVERVLQWMASRLHASRVELVSADAGPVTTIQAVGAGLATSLGPRAIEAGIAIGPEPDEPAREIAVPVRAGGRLLAAIALRWPADVVEQPAARETIELSAAIVAPRVEAMLQAARATAQASASIPELVGLSQGIEEVRRAVARAAAAPFAVLIDGESGTGKELVARAVHQLSPRRERRFCDVNCAALPDDLLESELFGHVRGAFTGAVAERAGLFEEADGGTLFLDELADLSARAQAKLLRAIQQQEVRRIGESFSRKVDVRLVAAVNRDMRVEVEQGRFRQDLFYRLDVVRIRIPPLRERPEDIAILAQHFWRSAAQRVGTAAVLTHGVLAALSRYAWPGNVRELQNVMSALAVAAPMRGRVRSSLLPAAIAGLAVAPATRLAQARAQFERRFVEMALARAAGNRARAARELGVSRQGLQKLLVRLGIAANAEAASANVG